MNKSEMAEKLAKKCDISQSKALECVNAIFESKPGHGIIATELDAGRKVQLGGFGTFDSKRRSARKGRNPATGETIEIAAKKYATFKAAKGLKDRVAD